LDKKKSKVSSNVGLAIIGGFLFWPALFLMDLSNVEKIEIKALRKRNKVLTKIAHEKGCDDVPSITTSKRQLVRKGQNEQDLEITR
jgi:hypothetical protein